MSYQPLCVVIRTATLEQTAPISSFSNERIQVGMARKRGEPVHATFFDAVFTPHNDEQAGTNLVDGIASDLRLPIPEMERLYQIPGYSDQEWLSEASKVPAP